MEINLRLPLTRRAAAITTSIGITGRIWGYLQSDPIGVKGGINRFVYGLILPAGSSDPTETMAVGEWSPTPHAANIDIKLRCLKPLALFGISADFKQMTISFPFMTLGLLRVIMNLNHTKSWCKV